MTDVASPALTPYDQVPYDLAAFPQTHIGLLAAIGRIFGLRPADPRHCRVLELACGFGANLMAMAESFPDSQFSGFDLSGRQIATGFKLAHAVGLSNLHLETADIAQLDLGEERFDFILCHGAFSWIPPEVQERVLAICQKHLTPEGIAYISYNAHPGWQLRLTIRDLMRFHAGKIPDPKDRVTQGLTFLEFIQDNFAADDPLFQTFVTSQLRNLQRLSVSYVFHEYFGGVNQPLYFHQFMAQAHRHGLRYLGEAAPASMSVFSSPSQMGAVLQTPPEDIVRLEQYNDLRVNRTFRQTLLCHADRPVRVQPDGRAVFNLYAMIGLRNEPASLGPPIFTTSSGLRVSSSQPLPASLLAGLAHVGSFPAYMPALVRQIRARDPALERLTDDTMASIGEWLSRVLFLGGGCFYSAVPHLARHPTRRPLASQLARIMAGRGTMVFTPLNHVVFLDAAARCLIQHLDGTNDRSDLIVLLLEDCRAGLFQVQQAERKVADDATLVEFLSPFVDRTLKQFATQQVLVA